MASLREIIEKQKAAKVAEEQQKAPPVVVAQTPAAVPTAKPSGFSSRFANKANAKPPEQTTQSVQTPAIIPAEKPAPIMPVQKREDIAQVAVTIPPQPTAPQDLPDQELAELRRNLDFLANNIEQKELVGQVIRTIAVQLHENPQFGTAPYMSKADFNLIVRGLRKSFNVQARKKVEGGEKRAKNAALNDEYAKMVGDLGISL